MEPSPFVKSGARVGMAKLAGRATDFIFNEWYVAAFSAEVGRSLLQRTILGRSLVLYRTQGGKAVALDNRCPHRSYPLSASTLEGDTIVCGYHGMRLDAWGDCIDMPALSACPKGVGVRSYPLEERGPFLWIWMGDEADADPATISGPAWMSDPSWAGGTGYFHMNGSYVSLHENLLDTSHLSFIHINTIGSADYVKAPYSTDSGNGRFALERTLCPTKLPPALMSQTGLSQRDTVTRHVRNEFYSPAYYEATTHLFDAAEPEGERPTFVIRAGHMPTPETGTSTHYFIAVGRDFAKDPQSCEVFVSNLMKAFDEDVVALELQEKMQDQAGDELFEVSFASDALTISMRKYLKTRAEEEARARASAARPARTTAAADRETVAV